MNKKKPINKTALVALIASLVVLCICAIYIFSYLKAQKDGQAAYDKMQQEATISEVVSTNSSEPVKIPIDFAVLQKKNPDIYAWITLPGTVIDYPIVQSDADDNYYLNHTVEKASGLPGSIYTESANSKDFSDFNTVIYGHDMLNGTMFASLHTFEDSTVFENRSPITIYTPTSVLTYKIFAAYTFDNRHLLNNFDYKTEKGKKFYLDTVFSTRSMKANFDNLISVTTQNRIITLSTCVASDSSKRFLVQAVLS